MSLRIFPMELSDDIVSFSLVYGQCINCFDNCNKINVKMKKNDIDFGKRYTWEEVNILIINTTVNIVENSLLWTFRPSAGVIVNAKIK